MGARADGPVKRRARLVRRRSPGRRPKAVAGVPDDGCWHRVGSGCLLVGSLKFPYDAEYVRVYPAGRRETLTLYATPQAGANLPAKAATLTALTRRAGVVVGARSWSLERV